MTNPEKLTEIAMQSITMHEKRRSMVFIEAAVGQLIDSMGVEETQVILRHYADFIEEFKRS